MALAVLLLAVGGETAARSGALWNGTESLPFGLYWKVSGSTIPVHAGDYVVICAPAKAANLALARGYLPHGSTGRACVGGANPVLKRVYAITGDRYAVNIYGVTVNGALVRNSAPLRHDDRGRPLWNGQPFGAVLGPHEILALSAYNPASYDSRYFGPLDERNVWARVRPVLTAPYDKRA